MEERAIAPVSAAERRTKTNKQNKEKAIVPVSSVKQTKAMKREQAIVHEALSSCFFLSVQ